MKYITGPKYVKTMKTNLTTIAGVITIALISGTGFTQPNPTLIGMEEYVPVPEYCNISQKIHVTTTNDYDYQITDGIGDGIYMDDVRTVYQEARRIVETNGGDMTAGMVLAGSAENTTLREITRHVEMGDEVVFIQWDLPNGYHVYLNLRDEFCGVAVSMDEVE